MRKYNQEGGKRMYYNYPNYNGNYNANYNFGQQPTTDERIWVQGRSSADAYLVAPNGFVRLWDNNENVFYEKRADQTGRLYMDVYEYKKIDVEKDKVDRLSAYENRLAEIERRLENAERITNDTTVQRVSENVQRKSAGRSSETNKQRADKPTTA